LTSAKVVPVLEEIFTGLDHKTNGALLIRERASVVSLVALTFEAGGKMWSEPRRV
jgi:hypothetical protein